MERPQLIEVDPRRIKFTPKNPRRHQGSEFLRLKESVKEVGVVQLPTVRVLPGGFYEVIDGEGRVRAAQEAGLSRISVVSYGIVDDAEAATMLQAANTVRSFGLLAECRGLANLHRQGMTIESLAKKFGEERRQMGRKVDIGYFPPEIINMVTQSIAESEEKAMLWNLKFLRELLPLRQLRGQLVRGSQDTPIEGSYDYSEVKTAVELIVKGEISTRGQVTAYVQQRRAELLEKRFDKELRIKLDEELAQARGALEISYQQQLEGVQQKLTQQHEQQVTRLQQQVVELEKKQRDLLVDVARRPQQVEQLESELAQKVKEAEAERKRLQAMQAEVAKEAQKAQTEAMKFAKEQADQFKRELKASMDAQLAQMKQDNDAYLQHMTEEFRLKAEKSLDKAVAQGIGYMAQAQDWVHEITAPGLLDTLLSLKPAEGKALVAQMEAVSETMQTAVERIRRYRPIRDVN